MFGRRLLLFLLGLLALALLTAAPARADFGVAGGSAVFTEADGSAATRAGSHPFAWTVRLEMSTKLGPGGDELPDGGLKDLRVVFPEGLIGTPALVPRCAQAVFEAEACTDATAVGKLQLSTDWEETEGEEFALFNLVPPLGSAAELGFVVADLPVKIRLAVSPDPPYRVVASIVNITQVAAFFGASLTVKGIAGGRPFLTMPRQCEEPLTTVVEAASWQLPDVWTPPWMMASEPAAGLSGCGDLAFDPTAAIAPTSAGAGAPTGLTLRLDAPDPGITSGSGIAHADVRETAVRLPEGMTINAALATGLAACTAADLARESPSSPAGSGCPEAAKIGTAEVETPLLDEPASGALYVAQPDDPATSRPGAENPFDSLLAFYVVIRNARHGVLVKQPVRVDADPATGRLTASVADIPQLPFSRLELRFRDGDRALLVNPAGCGNHGISYRLSPSSGGPSVEGESRFDTASDCGAPGFAPDLSAGTTSTRAGASSSFVLRLDRPDRQQGLSSLSLALPPGVSADFGGVPLCPEGSVATGSCPSGSRIGSLRIAAGAGASPLWVPPAGEPPGDAFLAGPYKGAPFSLVAAVPAAAGPFDLGTVVTRAAIHVDRVTAQPRIELDPLPQIRRGIPISIRTIHLVFDRPGFIRNPTSCAPMSIQGFAGSSAGARAPLADRFQVGGCAGLRFRPKLSLRLLGPTHRSAHPGLRAVIRARPGDANIGRVTATLPPSELLDSRGIGEVCSAERFASSSCPADSIRGRAKVWTPLLDRPLAGPVYLRASAGKLPDLAVSLRGEVAIDLSAAVDSTRGRLRVSLRGLPDIPLSKVALTLEGGKNGLLVNSGGVCARRGRTVAAFVGKNGKRHHTATVLKAACKGR